MGSTMFQVDGVDVTIERRLLRERVYYNHRQVSERTSVFLPSLVPIHRFAASEPLRQFEVRTYEPHGWVVFRDGVVVASEPPQPGQIWLFGFFAVAQWLDFAITPEASDAFFGSVSVLLLALNLVSRLMWRRATSEARAHGAGHPAAPEPALDRRADEGL
jgi:hypothetical protein